MKFIFTARVSWKVIQGKTKFTLLIFVRSEEDDPLGPTPLDTYLLYYLLWGLSSCFLLIGHIIIKEWDFKPSAKAQVLAPTTYYYLSIILFEPFAIDGIHQVVPIHPFALTSLSTKGPSYLGTNLDGLANLLLTCSAVLNISCPSTNNLSFMAFP